MLFSVLTLAAYHEPAGVPAGWTVVRESPKSTPLELIFAVKQQNVPKLHDTLMAVATPTSPKYGQHLTNEEVHSLVAPSAEDVATVESFARDFGAAVKVVTPNRDMLSVTVNVSVAEQMLSAHYSVVRHDDSGIKVHRIAYGGYSLPKAVALAVDFVSPTVHVPGVRKTKHVASETIEGDKEAEARIVAHVVDDVEEEALEARAPRLPDLSKDNVPKSLRELYAA